MRGDRRNVVSRSGPGCRCTRDRCRAARKPRLRPAVFRAKSSFTPISCQRSRGIPIGFSTGRDHGLRIERVQPPEAVLADRLVGCPAHLGAPDRDNCSAPKTFPSATRVRASAPGSGPPGRPGSVHRPCRETSVHQPGTREVCLAPSTIVASTPTFTFVPSSGWHGSSEEPGHGNHHDVAVPA